MKLLVGVALLCLVAVTYAAPRVIGGKDAPEGKYKYQVSLRSGNFHFCGGSILNKRWILTAAHCIRGKGHESVKVVAGTNLLNGGNEQSYQSEYIVAHEKYMNPIYNNDVGLVRVDRDIEFNDKVQPIAVSDKKVYENGHPVKLTGWGSMKLGGTSPNKLQEIDLKLYDQEKCKQEMKHLAEVTLSHICTLTKAGEGSCHGDSGGPLVADGVQVGIVSFAEPCAKGYPDVFTRVHTFLDWIAAQQAKFQLKLFSDKLQEIELKLHNQEKCKVEMKDIVNVTDDQICTLSERGKGPSKYDLGGPLVANGFQVGTVPVVKSYCSYENGGNQVYTRVFPFVDWIAAKQAESEDN